MISFCLGELEKDYATKQRMNFFQHPFNEWLTLKELKWLPNAENYPDNLSCELF